MKFLLTAALMFLAFQPATDWAANSELFRYLGALNAVAPHFADVAGAALVWPAILFFACFGSVEVILRGLEFVRSRLTGDASRV